VRYMVTNVKSLERREEAPQYALTFIAKAHPNAMSCFGGSPCCGGWGELQSLPSLMLGWVTEVALRQRCSTRIAGDSQQGE
jgi:hypothetical protein